MKEMTEGVIKYDQANFTPTEPLPYHEYATIERYRKILNTAELISAYPDGTGYGNISMRKDYRHILMTDRPQFIISGTQTGHLRDLTGAHYTQVTDFSIEAFSVTGRGAIRASSETVTHASIYQMNPAITSVIHIHHRKCWEKMIEANYPSTSKWIPYGTYEMATAVKDCIGDKTQGLLVMKGHTDGIIAYGPNVNTAMNLIAGIYNKYADPKIPFHL